MPRCLGLLLSIVGLHAVAGPVGAATIHVNPDGSGDAPTIAAALAMALSGDVIQLGDGVFHEHDLALKPGVQLLGSADPSLVTIDAGGAGRCFTAANYHLTIRGITFRNGMHAVEGGIGLVEDSDVVFRDCVFRGGSAPRGGAIFISRGGARFERCRFESNAATAGGGGAIHCERGQADSCEFHGNTAQGDGGAVFTEKSEPHGSGFRASRCVFGNNTATGDGGAFCSVGATTYLGSSVSECTFLGNVAENGGAARLSIFDCVSYSQFLANRASGRGGALALVEVYTNLAEDCPWFEGCLFARNRAGVEGGACSLTDSYVAWYHCTWALNDAPQGGHVSAGGSFASWYQCILAFATSGGAASGAGVSGRATCSDVFGNAGGDYAGPLAGEDTSDGNFSDDPLFCGAAMDDYSLQESSPCVDTGCGQAGAYGAGCAPVAVDEQSWARLKGQFR